MKNSNKTIRGLRKAGIVAVSGLAGLVSSIGMSMGVGGCGETADKQYINHVCDYAGKNLHNSLEREKTYELYKSMNNSNEFAENLEFYNTHEKEIFQEFFRGDTEQISKRLPWTQGDGLRKEDKAVIAKAFIEYLKLRDMDRAFLDGYVGANWSSSGQYFFVEISEPQGIQKIVLEEISSGRIYDITPDFNESGRGNIHGKRNHILIEYKIPKSFDSIGIAHKEGNKYRVKVTDKKGNVMSSEVKFE